MARRPTACWGARGCRRAWGGSWRVLGACLGLGVLWWWAVLRLALSSGAGVLEGAVAAGGWGLSLLPVHCVPKARAVGAVATGRWALAWRGVGERAEVWGGGGAEVAGGDAAEAAGDGTSGAMEEGGGVGGAPGGLGGRK
ncbi:hypothetical protein [Streptomyces sp. ALI-76-A]|uniref:hypothetical protein n=1 Tax=Streptomyces sp. ALI-76-A TaxID=3025736 RepID=UPI00256E9FB7|nr:hypothetical protein [Streptomyces sp. ALI-76-A]MDL5204161.1 hypothetical protein [Streptomyces sp. ALI-76-A]